MKLFKIKYLLPAILLAVVVAPTQTVNALDVSPAKPDRHIAKIQRKVDQLYELGDYERAYFIYRNELAPLGDKYAQYMLGFMNLNGKGTDKDRVAASAWLRLAAERGTPQFVMARDVVVGDLNPDELDQSRIMYKQFRHEFSDLAILLASIKMDHEELKQNRSSVLDRSSRATSYYNSVYRRMEDRLATLSELGDFPDLVTDPGRVDIEDVERMVHARIDEALPD